MFLEFTMSYFQKYPVGWAPPTCNAADLAIMVGCAHPTLKIFTTLGLTAQWCGQLRFPGSGGYVFGLMLDSSTIN
jgi:hypothetical protein